MPLLPNTRNLNRSDLLPLPVSLHTVTIFNKSLNCSCLPGLSAFRSFPCYLVLTCLTVQSGIVTLRPASHSAGLGIISLRPPPQSASRGALARLQPVSQLASLRIVSIQPVSQSAILGPAGLPPACPQLWPSATEPPLLALSSSAHLPSPEAVHLRSPAPPLSLDALQSGSAHRPCLMCSRPPGGWTILTNT